jgi:hypothetical protein
MLPRRLVMQIMNTKKAADGQAGPKNCRPARHGLPAVFLAFAVLLAFAMVEQSAFAKDELLLSGIVKTIDPKTSLVFVDVGSESCPGIRRFHADDLGALGRYVNQTVTFYIDSPTCSDSAIHTILVSRGINK